MGSFDGLLDVQRVDTHIDQLRNRIGHLAELAALEDALRTEAELEGQLGTVGGQIEELESRQRSLEEQIASAAERRHQIEARMREAGIGTRELQAMDDEVGHLTERQRGFEDAELELVEEEEPLLTTRSLLEADLETARTTVAARRQEYEAARESVETELVAVEGERAERAASVDPELLERYDALRSRLGGVAIARLVGNRCDGCHLELPSMEVDRIRHLPEGELTTCEQCGRMLVP